MLTCIIIDDEPNAVNLLDLLIAEVTDWKVADRCYNGLEALRSIKTQQVDFIFLDINMPQLNGMELAALLPADIKIVFTTAYSEYAAESYLHHTLDYLLKPITLQRFITAQLKIEAFFAPAAQQVQSAADLDLTDRNVPLKEYFYIKIARGLQKIRLANLLYVEGDKEYVKFVTSTETFLVYRRMKSLEEELKYPFIRIHNSYIINIDHMDKLIDNHVQIRDQRIPLSDKYRKAFLSQIANRLL